MAQGGVRTWLKAGVGVALLALASCAAPSPAPAPRPPQSSASGPPVVAAPPPPMVSHPRDACGAAPLQYLVGKPRTEIPVPVDPSRRRVICSSCTMTRDVVSYRQTIIYDAETGLVKSVSCG